MTQATIAPAPPRPATAPPVHHRLALAIIVTAQLMLVLDATVMNVALVHIKTDLHLSTTGLTWVMTAYTLTFGGLLLLGGRAGDVLGRRRLFVGGVSLFTAASLVGGLAPSAGWLLAARVAQGLGAAAAGPSTIALITTTFTDARERVRALALLSAASGSGFAIGLIVGGFLTQTLSWRWVLFINVPFGLAAALLAPRLVTEPPRHRMRLDLPGAITATVGVASGVYGLLNSASYGWADPATLIPIGTAVVLLGSFIAIEARTASPLMPLRLFADRNRAAGYVSFLLGPASMMSMFFLLSQYMQDVRDYSPIRTGLAFLPLAVAIFVMTRIVPGLLPRFGARPLAVTGSSLMLAGLAWLAQVSVHTTYRGGLLGPMLLMGVGAGTMFIPLAPVIFASVPARDAGSAGGALQTMQQIGASLGVALLVTVATAAARHHPSAIPGQPMTSGLHAAFTVSAGLAAVLIMIGAIFRRAPLSSSE